ELLLPHFKLLLDSPDRLVKAIFRRDEQVCRENSHMGHLFNRPAVCWIYRRKFFNIIPEKRYPVSMIHIGRKHVHGIPLDTESAAPKIGSRPGIQDLDQTVQKRIATDPGADGKTKYRIGEIL